MLSESEGNNSSIRILIMHDQIFELHILFLHIHVQELHTTVNMIGLCVHA
jgi:hypothetical protein